ncbi:MAG: MBL fold metallo-hydrolase [Pseudomonadota bacterium]
MTQPSFFTTSLLRKPERFVLRGGAWRRVALRVRVGYLHHPVLGHTLIDTGYGPDVTVPGRVRDRFLSIYRALLRPNILTDAPLRDGLARVGITPEQIDTLIVTHFHADHVGALSEVPGARVICARECWDAMQNASRVRNARAGVFPSLLPDGLEDRLVFIEDCPQVDAPDPFNHGRDIGGDGRLIAVDLPGHLQGHFGVVFAGLEQPFLYAADVQWLVRAIVEDRAPGPPTSWIHHDAQAARKSVSKVRTFAGQSGEVLLCHDPNIHPFDIDPEVGG